ncbi:hypothetical protein DFH06DRAFT_1138575 [Mycena polygramma]|nr:hypothetical protein DFH06DRAFT_1138575 [Mycena polygramma]
MTPRVAEHSEDLGAAESAESAGLIGIGGGIVGDGTGTEGQRTIRTDRTCGSWKAGKCREPGGNPEDKDRRDRRTTIEEEEDVERGRMWTEATGGGRSIGSGETRKVNRDNRKRRKSRRRSKVDTEAHGGARGRSVPERPKSRKSREGRRWECRPRKMSEPSAEAEAPRSERGRPKGMKIDLNKWCRNRRPRLKDPEGGKGSGKETGEDGKTPTSSGSDSGPRPRKPKPERELENCHIVEFGLGSETVQAGTGRKEGRWKETEALSQSSTKISEPRLLTKNRAKPDSAGSEVENSDREWNEKSRLLVDQCSISEARRFGVGVAATSEQWPGCPQTPQTHRMKCKQGADRPKDLDREQWTRNSETGGRENECKVIQSRLGSRLGRDPGRAKGSGPKSRKSGDASGIGDPVRRVASEYGIRRWEVGSGTTTEEDRRKTAQEVLVQSESANNSSEEKSEIIGRARKFEMPIPPLRVDVPSSSARFQLLRGYRGLTRSFRPKSQRDRQVKGEKLGEPETRQQERSGCRSATGMVVNSSMQGSEGAEASDEVPEEPKHLTNQSREATAKTEANARMFGRVPMARAAEAEHDRKESPNGESPEGDDG